MDGRQTEQPKPRTPTKFSVYQNPVLLAALSTESLRPSKFNFLFIFSLFSAAVFTLVFTSARFLKAKQSNSPSAEGKLIEMGSGKIQTLGLQFVSQEFFGLLSKTVQAVACIVIIGTAIAFMKAISLLQVRNVDDITVTSPSEGSMQQVRLSHMQLGLIGLKPRVEPAVVDSSKKPPKSITKTTSPSEALVPVHQSITVSSRSSRLSSEKLTPAGGTRMYSFRTPLISKSPVSPSLYLVPGASSQSPTVQNSASSDKFGSTPWSNKRAAFRKEITSEQELEKFLADVDEKISESSSKLTTPPPTIAGFGIASPTTIASSSTASGTRRSTPLRPVRMSPGSQKFTTPPKKGEVELPPPMSMEESTGAFERLGIYPDIELWRDRLRQWFSLVLLNPLLTKIDTSNVKVMQTATKLGGTVTVSQVGSDTPSTGTATAVSAIGRTNEWQPAFAVDEDSLLHQLRTTFVQTLDACLSKFPAVNSQQSPQQQLLIPTLQEGIGALSEHQRLHALMKGEWGKGLLPQSSVRADYTVSRVRELAEGTCVKNYEYLGNGEVYDKVNQKCTTELPTDSHLLLYLFCAYLEYPKWMLHVDPTSYSGSQSSKNPLFLGVLPPKERFPEKYVAVVSGVPSVLHPGACVLAVGKQSPPVFTLYWDKKPQFSLQGRTALWDSILLLCYKIKTGYGGIVRGMHLSSPALEILPVLDSDMED